MTSALILFGLLFLLLALCVPVGYAIGLACCGLAFFTGTCDLSMIPAKMITGNDSFIFLAVPMFTFAGYLMEAGNITERLVDWVNKVFGRMPGSMGAVAIITCAIFAALTGSGAATTAAVGAIMYPLMLKAEYSRESAAGIIASGAVLGPVIPPSIPMIIYGSAMGVSISDMFLGGVVPGVLMAGSFLLYNTWYAIKHKLPRSTTKYSLSDILKATWHSLGVLMLPVIILGGIYSGLFTPTEAAAVAIVYTTALMIAYGRFSIKRYLGVMKRTAGTTGVIMLIVALSNAFSFLLTKERIPSKLTAAVVPMLGNAYIYLAVVIVIFLIAGALMDTAPALLILAPILVPIGVEFGLSELHLGVLMCIVMICGLITPPFGLNLFTISSTSGVSFEQATKGAAPMIGCCVIICILCAYIPALITFLPSVVGG